MAIFSIYFYSERDKPSYICEYHKDFYLAALSSGSVIEKYIDTEKHAIKTVLINEGGKVFKIYMIAYPNWKDYEMLKVGDLITKKPKSFDFKVNDDYQFELEMDCKY